MLTPEPRDARDDLAALREELRRERARADRLEAENADLRALLDALRNSTLWRALEPVRRLGSRLVFLRRLVRLLRQRRAPAAAAPLAAEPRGPVPQVAFLSGDPGSASEIYRVQHPLEFLRQDDIAATAAPFGDLAKIAPAFARARALVLFRCPWTPLLDELVGAARGHGAAIVYDVDDLVFEPELGTVEHVDGLRHVEPQDRPIYRERLHANRRALDLADLAVLSTDFLAERVRALGKPAEVLANGADAALLAAAATAPPRPADGRLRLGYASGTLTHQKDFAAAAPALARLLAARPEITLTVLGRLLLDDFPDLARFVGRIERRPPVPHDRLLDEIARFDVNLAPLDWRNPYCAAKSELKYLHAALVGVPTVASPSPPFRTAIAAGRTGLLAESDGEWLAALDRLTGDADLRRRMGDAARQAAIAAYGPETKAAATCGLYRRWL